MGDKTGPQVRPSAPSGPGQTGLHEFVQGRPLERAEGGNRPPPVGHLDDLSARSAGHHRRGILLEGPRARPDATVDGHTGLMGDDACAPRVSDGEPGGEPYVVFIRGKGIKVDVLLDVLLAETTMASNQAADKSSSNQLVGN